MSAEQKALESHMAQAAIARLLQVICAAGGVAFAFWHGWPAIIWGMGGAWFFSFAMPAPCQTLDRATGRKQ
mgnify:CR=1 FL=1